MVDYDHCDHYHYIGDHNDHDSDSDSDFGCDFDVMIDWMGFGYNFVDLIHCFLYLYHALLAALWLAVV